MAVALPSQELLGKPYRILHSSQHSLNGAIERIKNWSKQYKLPVRTFMESTRIYHFPMYYKLKAAGFDTYILNPLVTHATKDINVRNVHNNKFDAQKIALLGLRPGLELSKRGSPYVRRCIYLLAIQSVSLSVRGTPKNPVLRSFYLKKCKLKSKKSKMTVLGAVMNREKFLFFLS